MSQGSNATDYVAIGNTLARYCVALDTKNWELLHQVFTDDVDAKYPFPGGEMKGVAAVAGAIRKRLTPITSQHALTTQTIEIREDGETASASTYFTGIHFGQGKWQGQQVTAYGRYVDELVCKKDSTWKIISGSSGHWLIAKREVYFMGRVGEEGVMRGEEE